MNCCCCCWTLEFWIGIGVGRCWGGDGGGGGGRRQWQVQHAEKLKIFSGLTQVIPIIGPFHTISRCNCNWWGSVGWAGWVAVVVSHYLWGPCFRELHGWGWGGVSVVGVAVVVAGVDFVCGFGRGEKGVRRIVIVVVTVYNKKILKFYLCQYKLRRRPGILNQTI